LSCQTSARSLICFAPKTKFLNFLTPCEDCSCKWDAMTRLKSSCSTRSRWIGPSAISPPRQATLSTAPQVLFLSYDHFHFSRERRAMQRARDRDRETKRQRQRNREGQRDRDRDSGSSRPRRSRGCPQRPVRRRPREVGMEVEIERGREMQTALALHSLAEMLRGYVSACHSLRRRHR
jgi:hypothetical protein